MERLAILGGERAVPAAAIPKWPFVTEADRAAVNRVLDQGVFSHITPEIDGLQKEWAEYVGTRHCLATNSGTAALHMSVAAAGIGPGDEVIVPAYTFVATGTAVLHHNAIPVFVDVEPDTWNLDVSKFEAAITPSTKAIIPVHLNGYPADMDEINAVAAKHGLTVIEDACQAHGALYKGRKAGSLGQMAAFSLNTWKCLAAGDGGLFNTDDEDLMERARMVREFGERIYRGKRRDYNSYAMGWMYRTTEFVGAFTRSQLARLDEMNRVRVENALYLKAQLEGYDFVSFPKYKDDRTCVYWFFPLMLSAEAAGFPEIPEAEFRDTVSDALAAEGLRIGSWQRMPLPAQAIFRDRIGYGKGSPWTEPSYKGSVRYDPADVPVAQAVSDRTTWLSNLYFWPSGKAEMDLAAAAFRKVFAQRPALFAARRAP